MTETPAVWSVIIQEKEKRYLSRLPRKERERLLDALSAMQFDPFAGDVARLKGSFEGWRLRVGRWRVLFVVDQKNKVVVVAGLGPRGDVYK
ncbi:type II toxin-antitoxin system RelE family toxin [Desulfolutivibrio sp.]|uniref:type II toxin-antitoxin system RelE family toxin n=1 Tax=Desulfolutivibrio sp. TaxID=2773296 RepID=UPI002F9695BB